MRTALVLLTVVVATVVLAPVVAIASLLGVPEREGSVYEWAMRHWARALNRAAGVKIVVHDRERILKGRGAVYVINHVSWFDVFVLASFLPRYTWIAKAELARLPIFGWGARRAGVIFIERENRKSAFESYRLAAAEVTRGRNVVVAPEGTRGPEYALRPFKKGPFVLAIAAGAPIVPVIVYGAREVMGRGWRVRSGTVHVHILEPIEPTGYDYEHRHELMAITWRRMAAAMHDLHGIESREDPHARAGSTTQLSTS
ncbi:MAG: lysophospholipid acyltransferase family protein [Gemmatimonadaceae bacterium]